MGILSLAFWILIFILGTLYFIPTIIAKACNKKNSDGVFIVNFTLGWTIIGWIIALMWAISAPQNKNTSHSIVIKETYEKHIDSK